MNVKTILQGYVFSVLPPPGNGSGGEYNFLNLGKKYEERKKKRKEKGEKNKKKRGEKEKNRAKKSIWGKNEVKNLYLTGEKNIYILFKLD